MTEAAPSRARTRQRQATPIWSWLLPAVSVMAALGIPLLIWYAWDAIANSTDGAVTETVNDPSAPGYQVIVDPSPSHMILSLDPAGDLAMVTVVSLGPDDRGGNILHITPETLVPDSGSYDRIIDAYRDRGATRTRRVVARLLDINVDDITVLDAAGWAQLVGPAGAIPVDLSQDLVQVTADGAQQTVFAAGNVTVEPAQVSEFLGWVNAGTHPGARLERTESFWNAWLATITASTDEGIVPGEVDTGIGRFLRGLASATSVTAHYEWSEVTLANDVPAADVAPADLRAIVQEMVPFPIPAIAGDRPAVRLLDGVGGLDLAGLYSPPLVANRAEIVLLGNASTFGVASTEVVYHDAMWEDAAFQFATALGGATVTFEPVTDVLFDVTIIIGEDLILE